jgi:acetyltransferase
MPVNPKHTAIEGVLTYPDIASLPVAPDLAVLATPPSTIPALIAELGERGTKAAVIITAGFGEAHEDGPALRQQVLDAAKPHLLRVVGPNCIGIMAPGCGLNASFAHIAPKKGHLAFVAQSGAMVTSVLDWATSRGIGFSHFASLGDMTDVDFGDVLDYLSTEPDVRGILLYVEAVTHARKFMSAARAASRLKPVIVIKAGRHPEAAAAAASHTGALAGSDAVYDAAFRRAGMLRVQEIGDLFGAVETLAVGRPAKGNRLTILTNGGGVGVMATDSLIDHKGRLASLSEETINALDGVLPATWSHSNPVDIIGDASADRYAKALEPLLADKGADATLVLFCPTAMASGVSVARSVVDTLSKTRSKHSVLTCWLGEEAARPARKLLSDSGVSTYFTPERAVRAFMDMVHYRENQESLTQTPPSVPEEFDPDVATVRRLIDRAIDEGREWLTEPEAKSVLEAYQIPTVPTRTAANPQAAATAAAALGGAVVLKILSRDIVHKSDVGGVALDLRSPGAVRDAAKAMLDRVKAAMPDASVDGFTVQPMIDRPGAYELIVGVSEDIQFGPVILFGQGGTAAEILNDTALALPPLNMHLAKDVIARTRISGVLSGYRGKPSVALDELALTLLKVSQLAVDYAEIVELDINPLLADEFGVMALDARIRVKPSDGPASLRLAIRPYPKELEEVITAKDGKAYLLRPIRPEDEPAAQDLFSRLSPEDIRMRFFGPKGALSHTVAARMTQIDYDREMALVLADPDPNTNDRIYGGVRIISDPNGEQAEYSVLIESGLSGSGLGHILMKKIIAYAKARKISEIFGDVLRENKRMLGLCEKLGFSKHAHPDDPAVIEVRLPLAP